MMPLTAQFCVVCWLKEEKNLPSLHIKRIVFMKASSFRMISVYINMWGFAIILLFLCFFL